MRSQALPRRTTSGRGGSAGLAGHATIPDRGRATPDRAPARGRRSSPGRPFLVSSPSYCGRGDGSGPSQRSAKSRRPVEEGPVTEAEVRELLASSKVIAVVGLSPNADRPSNQIAWYLHHQGYELYGVNPMCGEAEVFGIPVLERLDQVPKPIDIVDVFRRAEFTPEVARAAVAVGGRALWLQLGIRSAEARAIAEAGGLAYVEDHCIKVEHARLLGARAERR